MSSPTLLHIDRLSHVKALIRRAERVSLDAAPLNAHAVLLFHDAVECFVLVAADFLGLDLRDGSTMEEFWIAIAKHRSIELPSRVAILRLSRMRAAYKQYGAVPSTAYLRQAGSEVNAFMSDATRQVFRLGFGSIQVCGPAEHPARRDPEVRAEGFARRVSVSAIALALACLEDVDGPRLEGPVHRVDG